MAKLHPCRLHVRLCIERKLGREVRSAVNDDLCYVFDDPVGANDAACAAFDGELRKVHVSWDTSESEKGGQRMNCFLYVETYWLSKRLWTTISSCF